MWIVKNETSSPLALPELKLEISAKEYVDLDVHGRGKAEKIQSLTQALTRGSLRTITKTAAEDAPEPSAPSLLKDLKDLVEHPPTLRPRPMLIPTGEPEEAPAPEVVGVKESFRRMTQRKRQEDGAAGPETVALRKELERFRTQLLDDISKILDDYLRP